MVTVSKPGLNNWAVLLWLQGKTHFAAPSSRVQSVHLAHQNRIETPRVYFFRLGTCYKWLARHSLLRFL